MYKYIEPEVAGGLGPQSIIDTTIHPPKVIRLNYEFSGWQGDDILESFPCYIVSERLMNEIKEKKLTGVEFDAANVSMSVFFI